MGFLKGGCLSLFLAYDFFLHIKEANSHWEFKARVNCTYHPFVTDVNQKALCIDISWKTSKPLVCQFEKEMKTSKKLWWLCTLQMEQVFLLQGNLRWTDPYLSRATLMAWKWGILSRLPFACNWVFAAMAVVLSLFCSDERSEPFSLRPNEIIREIGIVLN